MYLSGALSATTRSGYDPPMMGNRIAQFRKRLGWTQGDLARQLGTGRSTVAKLEGETMQLTPHWMRRIAGALDVAPTDLLSEDNSLTVPVAGQIASFAATCDLPGLPKRIAAPPLLRRPEDCAAYLVADDSADRLYPAGSILFVRRLGADRRLVPGAKIVVSHRLPAAPSGGLPSGRAMELLVGMLDLSLSGDVLLATRSRNPELPPHVTVQRAAGPAGRFDDAPIRFSGPDIALTYDARPEDPAEILGTVVMAITPEE